VARTNKLQHGSAKNCSITTSQDGDIITLNLANDEVPPMVPVGRTASRPRAPRLGDAGSLPDCSILT
jgi:hypothetical protein